MSDTNNNSLGEANTDPQYIGNIIEETGTLKVKVEASQLTANDILLDIQNRTEAEKLLINPSENKTTYEWDTQPNFSINKDYEGSKKFLDAKTDSSSNNNPNELLQDDKQLVDNAFKDIFKESFKNPIDFVHYIEMDFPKLKIKAQKTVQTQKRDRPKYDEIQSEPLIGISDLVASKKIQMNVIKVKGDWFFAGDAFGKIYVFSISKNREVKVLYDKDLKESCVNCIEMTQDEEYMLSAYSSGVLALWEVKSFKCKKVIDKIHGGAVISIKIFNKIKKNFEFFSSDFDGNVHRSVVKDRLVTFAVTTVPFILQNKNIVYIVDMIEFAQLERDKYPSLCNFNQTVVIGCLTQIKIITLEPEISELFTFEKPEEIEEYEVPDVGYGLGYAPFSNEDLTNKDTSFLLLVISWGTIAFLFKLVVKDGGITSVVQIGYYINIKTILRIGFISHSIILIVDSGKYFRAISTRDFTSGANFNSFNEKDIKGGRLIDSEIQYQNLFQDKNLKWKCTYNNFIQINSNSAFFLGKKNIYKLHLLNWEKCIQNITQDSNKLLIVSTDIYHGRQGALADIPQDDKLRKDAIKNYLEKQLIVRNDLQQDEMETYMNNIIELCIEIGMIDFLLTRVGISFTNFKDQFLQKLEPFILCDKLLKFNLTILNVEKIIDLYATNQQIHLLEQLLIHFNILSIDSQEIKKKCEEYHLIDPLIYICMNGKEKKYFEPITKIYNIFTAKSPSQTSYEKLVKDKKLSEIIVSKEYIGYKLFWYINWCLKGLIFPTEKKMTETEYYEVVLQILPWLLREMVFADMIKFDSKCLFSILKLIFGSSTILTFLDQANKSESKQTVFDRIQDERGIILSHEDLPIALIRLIEKRVSEFQDRPECLACYHEFVAKASSFSKLDHDSVYETIGYLLLSEDQNTKTDAEIIEISNDIISMIEKQSLLRDNDYYYLQLKSEKSLYSLVKIKLYEKDYNYHLCLNIFLQENSNIPNRKTVFFKWIDDTLETLSNGDKTTFSIFKNEVLNHLFKIGALSMDSMCDMMTKWYSENFKIVLDKLDSAPEVKLQYVEYIINTIKDKEEGSFEEDDDKMFILHIQLLCELKKGDRILPLLESNSYYPLKPCLELCLNHNIDDATIFLYQSTGAPGMALNICMSRLNNIFRQIQENLHSTEFSQERHLELLMEFEKSKEDCLNVCKKNGFAHDDLWFELLDKLYEINKSCKTEIETKTAVHHLWLKFISLLSHSIKSILELMTNYVSIIKVIDKITRNTAAEFKEMKESLVQIIGDYSHQLNILGSAKALLSGSVIKHKDEFIKLNCKGNEYSLDRCDLCQESFFETKNETDILTFFCGHKAHRYCNSQSNQGNVCLICQSHEIDTPINISEIRKPSNPIIGQSSSKKLSQVFKKKMEVYDKNIQERLKMVIEESVKL